jgi:hypothetical protein
MGVEKNTKKHTEKNIEKHRKTIENTREDINVIDIKDIST